MTEKKSKDTAQVEAKEKKRRHTDPPVSEWIVAGIGSILVFGAICFMIYEAVYHQTTPPDFSFRADSISQTEKGYLVRFKIKNTGDQAAAAVEVEGELRQGEEKIETASATLTYVPSNSEREGGFFFTKNPHDFELRFRVLGYEKP